MRKNMYKRGRGFIREEEGLKERERILKRGRRFIGEEEDT